MFSVKKEFDFSAEQECLIVGVFDKPARFEGVLARADDQFDGQLTELVKSGDISAKKKAIAKIHTFGKIGPKRLITVGLGKEKEFSFEELREALGRAFKEVKSSRLQNAGVYLDTFIGGNVDALDAAHAASEAFALSTYKFEDYKQKSNEPERKLKVLPFFVKPQMRKM